MLIFRKMSSHRLPSPDATIPFSVAYNFFTHAAVCRYMDHPRSGNLPGRAAERRARAPRVRKLRPPPRQPARNGLFATRCRYRSKQCRLANRERRCAAARRPGHAHPAHRQQEAGRGSEEAVSSRREAEVEGRPGRGLRQVQQRIRTRSHEAGLHHRARVHPTGAGDTRRCSAATRRCSTTTTSSPWPSFGARWSTIPPTRSPCSGCATPSRRAARSHGPSAWWSSRLQSSCSPRPALRTSTFAATRERC